MLLKDDACQEISLAFDILIRVLVRGLKLLSIPENLWYKFSGTKTYHSSARGLSLEIKIKVVGQVTILECKGHLAAGHGAQRLSNAIQEFSITSRAGMLLSLIDVPYVDSAGIGAIFLLRERGAGIPLGLFGANERVKELFQRTQMSKIVQIFPDETSALENFR